MRCATRDVRRRGAAPNLCYSEEIGDQDISSNAAACRPRGRCTRSSIVLIAVALLIACGLPQGAAAQTTCTITNSAVTLSGAGASCTIPAATLTGGSPTVAASDSAAITTNSNNVTISPNNGGSTGALAQTLGTITFGSGSIITGNFATAASAQTGGQIIFQPGSVISPATGGGEIALLANGVGTGGQPSQITATGLTVNMNGNGGDVGAKASGGGSILLNQGTTISFPPGGGSNIGLLATGANSQIVANGISDTMVGVGGGDVGVNADLGGKVTLTNSNVSDVGNGGGESGLKATNSGSIVTSGGSVSVVNGVGGLLQNGGTITMDGTNVTASGNGGNGFVFNSGASPNTLQYSNGTIVASGASFLVQGGATANIGVAGATATVNDGTLLQTSGTTTFNAQGSTLQGVILTQGGTSTVNLAGQTLWTMTGNSNATSVTNNNSEIIYTPPTGDPMQLASYKTLTANNYTGAGGRIVLNTFLGSDSSPSDRLVINGGTATGSTALRIMNTTGPGDQTVSNGILVVQTVNNATTSPGAFSLAGEVRGGAYDYFLFRGGLNGNAPQNWFLRSTFDMGPTPPEPPDIIPPPIVPPEPPPDVLPPGKFPIIGPELATYGAVQPMARQVGLATLGTLNQRIGDTMTSFNAGTDPNGLGRSDWARLFGQQINGHYQAFADPRADGWLAGFQGGIDLWRGSTISGHRDSAGLYLAYTQASADVTGLVTNPAATGYMLTRTGTNDIEAYSAGGYWTHYGPTGWYLDAILQGTLYRGNATTQFAQLPLKGTGFAASLETGYPIPLPLGPGFALEPQAQIIWQRVAFDDANDGLGPVGLGTTSGPIGRLGLRGQWNIEGRNGMLWQPYAGVNYWRSWGAEASTSFGIDQVQLLENMQTVEAFVGITGKLDKTFSVYAQLGYQFDVGSTINAGPQGAKGTAGIRYSW
jgi:outer membrane autotransporter protein